MILPNVDMNLLDQPTLEKVQAKALNHPPRILLLYGSNRERSYSRLAVLEAGRILEQFGAEVKIFHPKGLPLPEDADTEHPKVKELHDLLAWAEGMVWCSHHAVRCARKPPSRSRTSKKPRICVTRRNPRNVALTICLNPGARTIRSASWTSRKTT